MDRYALATPPQYDSYLKSEIASSHLFLFAGDIIVCDRIYYPLFPPLGAFIKLVSPSKPWDYILSFDLYPYSVHIHAVKKAKKLSKNNNGCD